MKIKLPWVNRREHERLIRWYQTNINGYQKHVGYLMMDLIAAEKRIKELEKCQSR